MCGAIWKSKVPFNDHLLFKVIISKQHFSKTWIFFFFLLARLWNLYQTTGVNYIVCMQMWGWFGISYSSWSGWKWCTCWFCCWHSSGILALHWNSFKTRILIVVIRCFVCSIVSVLDTTFLFLFFIFHRKFCSRRMQVMLLSSSGIKYCHHQCCLDIHLEGLFFSITLQIWRITRLRVIF